MIREAINFYWRAWLNFKALHGTRAILREKFARRSRIYDLQHVFLISATETKQIICFSLFEIFQYLGRFPVSRHFNFLTFKCSNFQTSEGLNIHILRLSIVRDSKISKLAHLVASKLSTAEITKVQILNYQNSRFSKSSNVQFPYFPAFKSTNLQIPLLRSFKINSNVTQRSIFWLKNYRKISKKRVVETPGNPENLAESQKASNNRTKNSRALQRKFTLRHRRRPFLRPTAHDIQPTRSYVSVALYKIESPP